MGSRDPHLPWTGTPTYTLPCAWSRALIPSPCSLGALLHSAASIPPRPPPPRPVGTDAQVPILRAVCWDQRTVGTGWELWGLNLQAREHVKVHQTGRQRRETVQREPRQACIVCGFVPTTELQTFFPCTAVDEQNAQTQEQERLVLGLSESEEKKDLKADDRMCHGESCGVTKCRSLRKGTGRRGDPRRRPGAQVMRRKLAEGGFRALSHRGFGPLAA